MFWQCRLSHGTQCECSSNPYGFQDSSWCLVCAIDFWTILYHKVTWFDWTMNIIFNTMDWYTRDFSCNATSHHGRPSCVWDWTFLCWSWTLLLPCLWYTYSNTANQTPTWHVCCQLVEPEFDWWDVATCTYYDLGFFGVMNKACYTTTLQVSLHL